MRTFTSSGILLKTVLPQFVPTSSRELDSILSELRRKVFIPGCLNKEQLKLISKERYKARLESEPVMVTIDGQEVRLEHINPTKDLPNIPTRLSAALELMKDRQDWITVPLILEGLRQSKRKLPPKSRRLLVQKAEAARQFDIILDCARRVLTTGFALDNAEIIRSVVGLIQKAAIDSNWEHVDKSLRWAEAVDEMMQNESHRGTNTAQEQKILRNDLVNTGRLLQLAALKAQRLQGSKDEDGKVASYAKDVLRADFKLEKAPDETQSYALRSRRFIDVTTAVHGLRVARDILDPSSTVGIELPVKLSEVEPLLEAQYTELVQAVAEQGLGFDKLATRLYENLLINGAESRSESQHA